MDKEILKKLANNAIEEFFDTGIDDIVNNIVDKIIENNCIKDENDITYLRTKIKRGILKWD